MYNVEQLPQSIPIGRQSESGVQTIEIDCSPWYAMYPNGTVRATFRPPRSDSYIEISDDYITRDGNIVKISVKRGMTQRDGTGSIVLRIVDGDIDRRSSVVDVFIEKGHDTTTGPQQIVVDLVNETYAKLNVVEGAITGP